ncbi:rCG51123 [Rattus norvegicus]|uniref:RCG51123 n=1 Tax=Rattus norvegicus TaxID=10116 RepID=A6IZE9_RAT|nr:rCG51123 [Rattus norvegicus]
MGNFNIMLFQWPEVLFWVPLLLSFSVPKNGNPLKTLIWMHRGCGGHISSCHISIPLH